ncbi:XRE family transcriptional regulator [Neptunomonas concharum]|uniref:Helix-turn-helix domain-containing protein n=1 Tax=Neptunomonas concharum TaxID=1031538 RepID=A0A5P1R9H6_9GAMM|nr:S24 family peptidase [Neptunomonas concharum]QEQ96258.1 helix-turn-helix domain-containing protein [Neptunomonas concharum]
MMLKDRFKTARKRRGLSQQEVADGIGVAQNAIAKIESGETKQPRKIEDIAAFLGVTSQWLLFGNGPNHLSTSTELSADNIVTVDSGQFVSVPVYESHLAAGTGAYTDNDVVITYKPVLKETLDRFHIPHNAATIATVSGDSMESTLQDKDVILINSSASIPTSGKIYAFEFDGDLRVKRFNKRLDGSWLITSDNPDKNIYRDEVLSSHNIDQLRIIGQVVTIVERNLL